MPISVVMPALEMAQETGKLISWLKQEGQTVAKGEPLLEVETDKAVMEIESPGDGILSGVKVQGGDVVPVGQTIAWLVNPGEAPPTETAQAVSGRRSTSEMAHTSAVATTDTTGERTAELRISPKARRLAKEHNVDLSRLRGTGSRGEILTADVLAFVEAKDTAAPAATVETLSSAARLMAQRTTESWTSVPHFFLVRQVDAGALLTAREKYLEEVEKVQGVRLTLTDLLVALTARVLTRHPRMNATWTEEQVRLNKEVNIGIAMAVEDAVVATVIHNTNAIGLAEIANQRRDLAERARSGKLLFANIAGATFTVSNLGMYNVDAFNAIIARPQAAILAVGRIADRVVPVDGNIRIRPVMTLTLSCDHRVVDGAKAAMFLDDLAGAMGEPGNLLRL